MIGLLRGLVAEIGEEEALIDVAGVGYVVRCGARTLARLPAAGEATTLRIETQWTDQAGMRLYGFASRDEQNFSARVTAALRNQFGGHAVKAAG